MKPKQPPTKATTVTLSTSASSPTSTWLVGWGASSVSGFSPGNVTYVNPGNQWNWQPGTTTYTPNPPVYSWGPSEDALDEMANEGQLSRLIESKGIPEEMASRWKKEAELLRNRFVMEAICWRASRAADAVRDQVERDLVR